MARETSGVKDQNIEITDDALSTLIKSYCRESGVRNLQKHIEKVWTLRKNFAFRYIHFKNSLIIHEETQRKIISRCRIFIYDRDFP